jgi:dTDP-4-dehydrorhamnose 3,5-epimerase
MSDLGISGVFLFTHKVHTDDRGFFREWFKKSTFQERELAFEPQQANFSMSKKGVLRGVHFSVAEKGQDKLVTCVYGEILDVLIDLRLNSPTYLAVEKVSLTADSGHVLFIPSGVGHSFVAMSEMAAVSYLTSTEFDAVSEKTISPLDPDLGIQWPAIEGIEFSLSERDLTAPTLKEAKALGHLPVFK